MVSSPSMRSGLLAEYHMIDNSAEFPQSFCSLRDRFTKELYQQVDKVGAFYVRTTNCPFTLHS